MSRKEKSLLGKARAAINKLGFVKTDGNTGRGDHEIQEPKSATLIKSSNMLLTKEQKRSSQILPESSIRRLSTEWEMYAIDEEDHQQKKEIQDDPDESLP